MSDPYAPQVKARLPRAGTITCDTILVNRYRTQNALPETRLLKVEAIRPTASGVYFKCVKMKAVWSPITQDGKPQVLSYEPVDDQFVWLVERTVDRHWKKLGR